MTFNSGIDSRKMEGAQGTVDATGLCEIDVPPVPSNVFWTGGLTVYDSPVGVTWTIYVNGIAVDVTTGPATTGQLQVGTGDTLVAKATGLTGYVGTTFHATFNCIESPADNTSLVVPAHDPFFVSPNDFLIAQVPYSNAAVSQKFSVPPATHSLKMFRVITGGSEVTPAQAGIQGVQTGFIYLGVTFSTGGSDGPHICDYMPLDTQINVTVGAGSTEQGIIYIFGTPDPAIVNVDVSTVPVQVSQYKQANAIAYQFIGGNSSAVLIAGGAGVSVTIYAMWAGCHVLAGAAALDVGAKILNGGSQIFEARVAVLANGSGGEAASVSIPGGVSISLPNNITLATDVGVSFGSGGIAYTYN